MDVEDHVFWKRILSISLEMERVYLGGIIVQKKVVQKLNGQVCPFKYTKWFLSISSEMERSKITSFISLPFTLLSNLN
jgi:hypothetical protein